MFLCIIYSVIQFFLRLGCSSIKPKQRAQSVYLQFSKNGGIVWETIQQFAYGPDSNKVEYIALDIPHKMKGPSTRVRWWQLPDEDDIYSEEWAIEEVHKIMD